MEISQGGVIAGADVYSSIAAAATDAPVELDPATDANDSLPTPEPAPTPVIRQALPGLAQPPKPTAAEADDDPDAGHADPIAPQMDAELTSAEPVPSEPATEVGADAIAPTPAVTQAEAAAGGIGGPGAHILPPLPKKAARPKRRPAGAAAQTVAPVAAEDEAAGAGEVLTTPVQNGPSTQSRAVEQEEVPVAVAVPVAPEDDEDGFDGAKAIEETHAAHADESQGAQAPVSDVGGESGAVGLPESPADDEDGFDGSKVLEQTRAAHQAPQAQQDGDDDDEFATPAFNKDTSDDETERPHLLHEAQENVPVQVAIPDIEEADEPESSEVRKSPVPAASAAQDSDDDFETPNLPADDSDDDDAAIDRRRFVRESAPEPELDPATVLDDDDQQDSEVYDEEAELAEAEAEEREAFVEEQEEAEESFVSSPPPLPAGRPPLPPAFQAVPPAAPSSRELPSLADIAPAVVEHDDQGDETAQAAVEDSPYPTEAATGSRPPIPPAFQAPADQVEEPPAEDPEAPAPDDQELPEEAPEVVEAEERREAEDPAVPVAPRSGELPRVPGKLAGGFNPLLSGMLFGAPRPPVPAARAASDEEGRDSDGEGDGAEGSGEEETGEDESEPEEDPELVRRRNIAARMARLGGGGGMMAMMGGGVPPPPPPAKPKKKRSKKVESVEPAAEVGADGPAEEVAARAEEEVGDAEAGPAPPAKSYGGPPEGGVLMPGMAPPARAVPEPEQAAEAEGIEEFEPEIRAAQEHEAEVDPEERELAEAEAAEREAFEQEQQEAQAQLASAPPPLPSGRPAASSSLPPRRSIPVPPTEQADEHEAAPVLGQSSFVDEPESTRAFSPPTSPDPGVQPLGRSDTRGSVSSLFSGLGRSNTKSRKSTSNDGGLLGSVAIPRGSIDLSGDGQQEPARRDSAALESVGEAAPSATTNSDAAPTDLAALSASIGAQIFAAAFSLQHTKGTTGQAFVDAALARAPSARPPAPGWQYGLPVLDCEARGKGGEQNGDCPRPGDILVAWEAKFKHNLTSRTVGTPSVPHLAVVEGWDAGKRKVKVLEVSGKGAVGEEGYRMDDLKGGRVVVFRVMGK